MSSSVELHLSLDLHRFLSGEGRRGMEYCCLSVIHSLSSLSHVGYQHGSKETEPHLLGVLSPPRPQEVGGVSTTTPGKAQLSSVTGPAWPSNLDHSCDVCDPREVNSGRMMENS